MALVEFALIAPLLFLLLFGIIEFGWAFLQYLDVRHGGREGARLAAVNAAPANGEPTQAENIAREVCNRMDAGGATTVSIDVGTDTDIGGEVTVTVVEELSTLTGFMDNLLDGIDLKTTVRTRLEQSATFADLATYTC